MDMYETIFWKHRDDLFRIFTLLWRMAGLSQRTTILRSVHRAVARLLRPAEAAVRRLIVVLAAEITVTLRAFRARAPGQKQKRPKREVDWIPFALPEPLAHWPDDNPAPFPGIQPKIDVEIDGTRLKHRLEELCHVLEDLDREAQRLARWTALRNRARQRGEFCTTQPLRPGPPVDLRGECKRRLRRHELFPILKDMHARACWAQSKRRDTS